MRVPWAIALLCACGDMSSVSPTDATPGTPDATPAPDAPSAPDAPTALSDAPIEDLDMALGDFANIQGFMMPAGRGYRVANPLGRIAEALAVASSPTGGTFPVGSIVEVVSNEVMVKRRKGWNATTNDWEFFGIKFAADGITPESFTLRGAQETACFTCHSSMSSIMWDFMCDHP